MVMGEQIGNSVEQHWMKSEQKLAFFSGSALYDSMTVRENLEFPLRRHTKNLESKGHYTFSDAST
jgi:phospholipid/cholesterol/gamma-HCH transport system ATP-binding protein